MIFLISFLCSFAQANGHGHLTCSSTPLIAGIINGVWNTPDDAELTSRAPGFILSQSKVDENGFKDH